MSEAEEQAQKRRIVSRGSSARGSLTVELVVLTPVIALFVLVALGFGRYSLAREQVVGGARAAADAAAVAGSAAQAPRSSCCCGHACAPVDPLVRRPKCQCRRPSHSRPAPLFEYLSSCHVEFSDLSCPRLSRLGHSPGNSGGSNRPLPVDSAMTGQDEVPSSGAGREWPLTGCRRRIVHGLRGRARSRALCAYRPRRRRGPSRCCTKRRGGRIRAGCTPRCRPDLGRSPPIRNRRDRPCHASQAAYAYLQSVGTSGTVTVSGQTVVVHIQSSEPTVILGIIGVEQIGISASASATNVHGVTRED